MQKFCEFILGDGGEGLVAKQPRSIYESGKTNSMVKVKVCSAFFVVLPLSSITLHLFPTFESKKAVNLMFVIGWKRSRGANSRG